MRDQQAGDSDLLKLQVPCCVETTHLEHLATCMYNGGSMELSAELVLPMLQLADAIQVCKLHSGFTTCMMLVSCNLSTLNFCLFV